MYNDFSFNAPGIYNETTFPIDYCNYTSSKVSTKYG